MVLVLSQLLQKPMYTRQLFLDVTVLPPREKHPRIFELFDALSAQESLLIYNDHDPKPLYYQMIAERGKTFNWEYIEKGPEVWRVEIIKTLSDRSDESIGEICAKDLAKAAVFKKYNIDFCCGGKKTIKQACKENKIDVDELVQALEQVEAVKETPDFQSFTLSELIVYIVDVHHQYVYDQMPGLLALAEKVSDVHKLENPELKIMHTLLLAIESELQLHQMKEEKVLFPTIKKMEAAFEKKGKYSHELFEAMQSALNIMEMEHDSLGNLLHDMRNQSKNYQLPMNACNSYRQYFQELQALENNLNIHMHLENNILFPKTVELEKSLRVLYAEEK